jgi:site-specific recombinase XerD
MCPHPVSTSIANRYDLALHYTRDDRLPPNAPRPLPTRYWPEENVRLLERYICWLLEGGACEYSTNFIYLPIAGHALGLNLKPHSEIDLESDLERAFEYVRAKGAGKDWLKASRNGLEKFRRFLRLERGLGEVRKATPFDIARHTEGLPAWLVRELERFQQVQSRNWRPARLEQNTHPFWSTHLRPWRFFCKERNLQELGDLKRQDILDYVSLRLNGGHAVAGVNTELRNLLAFLRFLQDEGFVVPQSLLRIPGLKVPDSLPKHITDEQIRLLRDDFEGRVVQAKLSNHRRDAHLDRAIFYLLWQCGLRTGEVEELKLEDLDLGGQRIDIRDSKGRKDRTVYITSSAIHRLQEYLQVRGQGSGDHVFLFRNAPLQKCFIHSRIKAAGERVGVKVHPHRLRHTCATQLLNAGCRVTSIQRFLGHKKLNTTMIYARAHDKEVAEDYFRAMKSVEKGLEIPSTEVNGMHSTNKMVRLVEALGETNLDSAQMELLQELRLGFSDLLKVESDFAKWNPVDERLL